MLIQEELDQVNFAYRSLQQRWELLGEDDPNNYFVWRHYVAYGRALKEVMGGDQGDTSVVHTMDMESQPFKKSCN